MLRRELALTGGVWLVLHIVLLLALSLCCLPLPLELLVDFFLRCSWPGLSFAPFLWTLHLKALVLLLGIVCGPMCMSLSHHTSSHDEEDEVNLSTQFQGLFISVRGSASSSVDFVQRIAAVSDTSSLSASPIRPASCQFARPGLTLRLPFLLVLFLGCVLLDVSRPLQQSFQVSRGSNEPGKQETGREQCYVREWGRPTEPLPLSCRTDSTWCCEGLALWLQPSLTPRVSCSERWGTWRDQTPSVTASPRSWRRRSTWQDLKHCWQTRQTSNGAHRAHHTPALRLLSVRFPTLRAGPVLSRAGGGRRCFHFGFCRDKKEPRLVGCFANAWTVTDEVLQSGTVADRTDLVGPHLNTKVDAALMSEEAPASDPLALDGQSVDVLLVDFSSDIAVYMKALTAPSQLQGILLFDPSEIGFIPSPSSLSSIAIAWTMDVAQSAPERMQFYSADEVPETPHPGTEEALPEADSPSGATTARAPKSSRLSYWKRVSPNFCPEEANGGHFGRQPGEVVSGLAGHHHTAAGSQFPHCSDRSQCGQPPRQVIHLEAALKQLSFGWIIECCGPPGLGQGDAPTEKFVNTREGGAKESLHREGDKRDGHGLPRKPCLGASSLGAIPSLDSFGCADGKWRPQFGVAFWEWAIQQRFNRARKTQERVSTAQGHLLHQCDPEYVQEDAPNYACGGGCGCIDPAWGYTTLVPGALWGLREDTRPGLHHLAGLNCDGLHAARELPSCHGLSGTPLCLSGAIGNGQWEDGHWIDFGFGGGPPTLPLSQPGPLQLQ